MRDVQDLAAFLVALEARGIRVRPDREGNLDVELDRSAPTPSEVADLLRPLKAELLAHFGRRALTAARRRPPWNEPADPALYGPDAQPRRHAPPGADPPPERPLARPDRLCGTCRRWTPQSPGSEMGTCDAGYAAHGLARAVGAGDLDVVETSRGCRCWIHRGGGWLRR